MKISYETYKRLIEITGSLYKVERVDDETIKMEDVESAIKDLIVEFGVVEECYLDIREKITKKIDDLEEHKFMIDMIDRWSDGDKNAWDKCVDQIKLLKSLLENDREQDTTD